MTLKRFYGVMWLVIILPASAAWAAEPTPSALEWLEKMSRAAQTLNYAGTFVYLQGTHMKAMRIFHKADASGEHERLVSLNGSAREVLRHNNVVTCIIPDSKSVVVEKRLPHKYFSIALPRETAQLIEYYRLSLLGQARVAGRESQIVGIEPKDRYRYGYRLWLDKVSGLLLKSALLNETGEPVEQVMFTSLKLNRPIPSVDLRPTTIDKGYTWYVDKNDGHYAATRRGEWRVTELPAGFMRVVDEKHHLAGSRKPVQHMVFSDGLATVSVYIEKMGPRKQLLQGLSDMGAVHVYGAEIHGHQVTVVGEVPAATVEMIGRSIHYQPNAAK